MTNVPSGAANTLALIRKAEGKLSGKQLANAKSLAAALDSHGQRFGMLQPHRLAQFLAQVGHESMGFVHDREIWGPTKAQKGYEGRTDLGNTQKGDGAKFKGHGPIQVTGRANTTAFEDWCVGLFGRAAVPDFSGNPDLINTDPWEGLSAIWYWSTRNLNRYADQGDNEMVTRRINGGINGLADRLDRYARYALAILGRDPADIRGFQEAAGLTADGIAGPRTRAALHRALVAMTASPERSNDIQSAPVIEETTVEKKTVPETVDKEVKKQTGFWGWLTSILGGGGGVAAFLQGAEWKTVAAFGGVALAGGAVALLLGPWIVRRIKHIRAEVEAV